MIVGIYKQCQSDAIPTRLVKRHSKVRIFISTLRYLQFLYKITVLSSPDGKNHLKAPLTVHLASNKYNEHDENRMTRRMSSVPIIRNL